MGLYILFNDSREPHCTALSYLGKALAVGNPAMAATLTVTRTHAGARKHGTAEVRHSGNDITGVHGHWGQNPGQRIMG